ncbi:MAG: ecdysteroid 22-kinase family protein, partial [Cyanobacteria bacterium]|nr:ecdysteroid 22-kinase family protein [Cyanobacteriota bacterium]
MSSNKPGCLWDISESFLGELLSMRFNRKKVEIKAITYEQLDCVDGFFSQIYRLCICYAKSEPQLPKTLVVKLDHKEPSLRRINSRLNAFEDEVHFYKEIAPLTNLKVPHCYYGNYDQTAGSGMLIFEDVSNLKGGDDIQ